MAEKISIETMQTAAAAVRALDLMLIELKKAKTITEVEKIIARAQALKLIFKKVEEVRLHAGRIIVLCAHRIGRELEKMPPAQGTRSQLKGRVPKGTKLLAVTSSYRQKLAELAGYKMKAHRLKQLAKYDPTDDAAHIKEICDQLAARFADITMGSVIDQFEDIEYKARRTRSRTAKPLPDGMDLRIGDCREVLADIPDNSVPLILTDPPYGDQAELLYQWLAQWSARVLIPGGSLICYIGKSTLDREMRIFGDHLRYWWLLAMLHTYQRRFPGRFVIGGFRPVLWYVKDHRRGRSMVPDLLTPSKPDKTTHQWGQGEAGVSLLIEHLTEPGELIVDPFAGTAQWGEISAAMGRRWIGADIVRGGEETILAAAE